MLRLTSSMKQNFTLAGTVIKEDNTVLSIEIQEKM
jgi:hypothetical protein